MKHIIKIRINGEYVDWESLTDEQREEIKLGLARKASASIGGKEVKEHKTA